MSNDSLYLTDELKDRLVAISRKADALALRIAGLDYTGCPPEIRTALMDKLADAMISGQRLREQLDTALTVEDRIAHLDFPVDPTLNTPEDGPQT